MAGTEHLTTDILIIGGGSAGSMAAIRAKELAPDLQVTIFEKGDLRRGGTIAMGMDALNNVVVPGVATEDDYLEAMNLMTEGIYDPEPQRVIARRSYPMLQKLEAWGIRFRRNPDGSLVVAHCHPNARFMVPMDAPDIKLVLAQHAEKREVRVLSQTMAVSLLVKDGHVCGAVGLRLRTGEVVVCAARAVILTAGGAARFGLPNSGYLFGTYDFPGNAGDGYVLGYRAGAALTGMECTTNSTLIKDLGIPLLSPAMALGAIVVDSRGEPVQKGKHGKGGGHHQWTAVWDANRAYAPLFLRVKHLPEERIRQIEDVLFTTERPAQKRFFEQRGIDFRQQDIELGPTEYWLCAGHGISGLVVDARARTTLEGLYAAGDVAAVAFQYLTGALVLGEVAAEEATAFARTRPILPPPADQVEAVERILGEAVAPKVAAEVTIHDFEYKVRRLINDYVVPPKNAWKLQNAIGWMHRLREDLRRIVRIGDAHEVGRYLEVGCIIDCAELSATASLTRTESRWGTKHYRSDYPERDDANWLRYVVLRRGPDGAISVTCPPVKRLGQEAKR